MKKSKIIATVLTAFMVVSSIQPCVYASEYNDDTITVLFASETDSDEEDPTVATNTDPEVYESTIIFHGNADVVTGEVDPIKSSIPLEEVIIPENKYVNTGYTFIEWNTESDGNGYAYHAGDIIIIPEDLSDIDLYAQWKANEYKVSFDGNGATSGTMDSINCVYGVSSVLPNRKFTRKGYTFTGWNTKKDGSGKSYSNKSEIINLTSVNGKNIKLYAQWKLTFYKINYVKGYTNTDNPSAYTMKTPTITLKTPTWKGHTFNGWFTDSAYTKKATSIKKGSVGDKTFYAKWTTNKYTVKYIGNGSTSGSMKNTTCKYGATYKLTKNAYKKTGYRFTGWNTKKDGSGKQYKNAEEFKNLRSNDGAVVNLYAQWKVNKYTVYFDANGGSGSMSSKTYKYDTKYTLPSNTFKNSGYVFAGWTTKATGSGTLYADKSVVSKLRAGNNASITFYAQWKPTKASITSISKVKYDKNTIKISSQKCDGYEIFRSTNSTSGYQKIATINSTDYSDTDVKAGTVYYYKVRAYVVNGANKKVYGDYSAVKSIKTALEPQFMAGFFAPDDSTSDNAYIYVKNVGTKMIYVGYPSSVINVFPSASQEAENGHVVFSRNFGSGEGGRIYITTDNVVSYDLSAYILFFVEYDDCSYICQVDRFGQGGYI